MADTVIHERLAALRAKLESRTDREGKPRKNYEKNVDAIKAEIAKLERKIEHGNAPE